MRKSDIMEDNNRENINHHSPWNTTHTSDTKLKLSRSEDNLKPPAQLLMLQAQSLTRATLESDANLNIFRRDKTWENVQEIGSESEQNNKETHGRRSIQHMSSHCLPDQTALEQQKPEYIDECGHIVPEKPSEQHYNISVLTEGRCVYNNCDEDDDDEYDDIEIPNTSADKPKASRALSLNNKSDCIYEDTDFYQPHDYEPVRLKAENWYQKLVHKRRRILAISVSSLLIFIITCSICWKAGHNAGIKSQQLRDNITKTIIGPNISETCDRHFGEHSSSMCPWMGKTDEDGWIVWLNRVNEEESFNKTWTEYVNGFGSPQGNLWLGLECLHKLTITGVSTLRIESKFRDMGLEWAEFNKFSVGSNLTKYALSLGEFGRGVNWPLEIINMKEVPFATIDNNGLGITSDCIDDMGGGGWWYTECNNAANPTGEYNNNQHGFPYITWPDVNNSMERITLKIK